MKPRMLFVSFVVVVLLATAIFYSGALTKPYTGDSEYYTIAHESSEAFEEHIEHASRQRDNAVSVAGFSEGQRRAFEKAKTQTPGSSGWRSLGRPPVCNPALITCNEYDEFPNPVNEGDSGSHMITVVEDSTGELYLVKIGTAGPEWNLDPIAKFLTKLVILGPYALFLAYRGWTSRPPGLTLLSVGYGVALVGTVFLYPYFLMFTEISLPSWHLPFLAIVTWSVVLAEVWRGRDEPQTEKKGAVE